jgi:hypothetical protein
VEDQEKQLGADITATSREITKKDREIEKMKNDPDVEWSNLVEIIDDKRRLQQGLKDLEALKEELF